MRSTTADILFYTEQVLGDQFVLSEGEMHHAVHVMRLGAGDRIMATDGKGRGYTGTISMVTRSEARVGIEETEIRERPEIHLALAIAPTKSFDRMEWCIEKLTETGVQTIIPMRCSRSERNKWNSGRAIRVAVSAMKQSKRFWLPDCRPLTDFDDVISDSSFGGIKYLAIRDEQSVPVVKHYSRGSDVLILIGPEGDFTDAEREKALNSGCVALSLGEYRLRTETAGIAAASMIMGLNQ